jgi:hypothetical protein
MFSFLLSNHLRPFLWAPPGSSLAALVGSIQQAVLASSCSDPREILRSRLADGSLPVATQPPEDPGHAGDLTDSFPVAGSADTHPDEPGEAKGLSTGGPRPEDQDLVSPRYATGSGVYISKAKRTCETLVGMCFLGAGWLISIRG